MNRPEIKKRKMQDLVKRLLKNGANFNEVFLEVDQYVKNSDKTLELILGVTSKGVDHEQASTNKVG